MAARVIPIRGAGETNRLPDDDVRQAFCTIMDILQALVFTKPHLVKLIASFLLSLTGRTH